VGNGWTTERRKRQSEQAPEWADRYLRLALKAQSQSRATVETLATVKNPPVVYAKQANFAAGAQQVNNGISPAHAGNLLAPSELTGPRTPEGKDCAKMNRYQGGQRAELTKLNRILRELFGKHDRGLGPKGPGD
jgi:hypothetical protein